MMMKGGMRADGTVPVTEIWRNFDQEYGSFNFFLEDMVSKMGKDAVKRSMEMVL
jgi:hypothetical protein